MITDRNFGLDRVMEPKGLTPATAWRLDNSWKLHSGEMRVRLERIHLEWDNFQQLCSSCGFDEERIKAKILDIIHRRGKLHNPFTKTAGVLMGIVDELCEPDLFMDDIGPGDKIYSLTSLCSIPLHIEEIKEVDFNYGQLVCSGYAILFAASPVCQIKEDLSPDYTLAAIDDAGSLFGVYQVAMEQQMKDFVIIGRNACTTMLYAAAVREAVGPQYRVTAIMDKNVRENLSHEEIRRVMHPLVKDTYFVDLTEPLKAYEEITRKNAELMSVGQVIIAEDIRGAETLGVMIVKALGTVYFNAVENHYAEAQMVAESMGKFVTMYAFDQYIKDYPEFSIRLLRHIQMKLEEINRLYAKRNVHRTLAENHARSILIANAGREDDFIYQSAVTKSMVEDVMNVARYDCNVIIQGETGVGKEKVLSLIHQNSERHGNPCIKINCATITESLAESEFFGYESGAFTGAQAGGKPGYFEMANNGILFLDEIGTLSLNMQSKLLRVLQENQFYRVGGTKQISVNVRVIVANNVPLRTLVDKGEFREDLYYRLNICRIDVPPLRERREDIICLSEAFIRNWCNKYKIDKALSPDAVSQLYEYYWPGNVRELENVVHRLVISSKDEIISGEEAANILSENAYGDMRLNVTKSFQQGEQLDFHQLMDQQEKRIIEYALKKEGTTRRAASLLGLPQTTLARKKLKYGL
ncbi:sigma-54 interaction domain-containing protein [Ihubacter sp. rT4E-8]|uniref:sigma-54 interaction domain-containing protein n=1 Tax=Ihubacter sp. rT4E-8 TaxID=3242369 RepID=UPI003CE670B5